MRDTMGTLMFPSVLNPYRSIRIVIGLWRKSLRISPEALNLAENTGSVHWGLLREKVKGREAEKGLFSWIFSWASGRLFRVRQRG